MSTSANDQLDCTELYLRTVDDLTERLWVRIKRRPGTDDILVVSATGYLTRKTKEMRPSTD